MRISTGKVWITFVLCSVVWLVLSVSFFFINHTSDLGGWRKEIQRLMSRNLLAPPGDNCTINMVFNDPIFKEEKQLRDWHKSEFHFCSHNIFVVPYGFARLFNVLLDPNKATGRTGGEEISQVINQPEKLEYWKLKPGAFRVLCPDKEPGTKLLSFVHPINNARSYLNTEYFSSTTTASSEELEEFFNVSSATHEDGQRLKDTTVFALTRYEYANLYHTVTYFYSIFANAIFYGVDLSNLTVLFIDGHPRGALDQAWRTLFTRIVRIGQLKKQQFISDLVLVMMGYDSPMFSNQKDLPMHELFRQFVLGRHGISSEHNETQSRLDCRGSRILIVWRRDYVAHPRNPRGSVQRKIANEAQLLAELTAAYPRLRLRVRGQAMESLTFAQQLSIVADTRVLIGMHGAGLTHAMFLPKRAGLIELFPKYGKHANVHFRSIAQWRGLAYERWVNKVQRDELPGFRTRIPNGLVAKLLGSVLRNLRCL